MSDTPIFNALLGDARTAMICAARTNAEMADAYRWSPLPDVQ